jgi:hypothetical protein
MEVPNPAPNPAGAIRRCACALFSLRSQIPAPPQASFGRPVLKGFIV